MIGSPYKTVNIEDINDIFFPLFSSQTVIRPGRKEDLVYPVKSGELTDAVFEMTDISSFQPQNRGLGPALCQALLVGRQDAMRQLSFDEHGAVMERFLRFFPEPMHASLMKAADVAYGLERKMGETLYARMGQIEPLSADVVSMLLKGQLAPKSDGTYALGEGKVDDSVALEGAICAVGQSRSWEEAVRRATALGGNSPLVAALTGGLAEIAFGVPEKIRYEATYRLDEKQVSALERAEAVYFRTEGLEKPSAPKEEYVRLMVLSMDGRKPVYRVPEDREDIISSIRKVNKDSVILTPSEWDVRMSRTAIPQDLSGNPLDGTYIDASNRPQVRTVYYHTVSGRLYSPTTLPDVKGFSRLESRISSRKEWEALVPKIAAIRDEQECLVGHDPSEGHLVFDSAWHIVLDRDCVTLMKGHQAYGRFGIDEHGQLSVFTGVMGGALGEGLEVAMSNRQVFHRADGPAEILSILREKCLDEDLYPYIEEEKEEQKQHLPIYDSTVRSNYDLMCDDLSKAGTLRQATFGYIGDVRTAKTRFRHDYARSGEAVSFDEAVYGRMHQGAVFTVGHSNLSIDEFIANLKRNGITLLRDVRSWPHSKTFPHFNQDELKAALEKAGIGYVFNGDVMGGHIRRTGLPSEGDGVLFTLSEGGYAQRTKENATRADLTLAFAVDFDTAGEKATEQAAKGKIIQIPLEVNLALRGISNDAAADAQSVFDCLTPKERSSLLTVNIAGNGLQTLAAHGVDQEMINDYIHQFLESLQSKCIRFERIISGGQTGADEAGIVAAKALGIPAEVHAPKGWMMRGTDGKDTFNEYAFKQRFISLPEKELSYAETIAGEGYKAAYDEIIAGAQKGERQAVMCSETAPTDSHRFACIGYSLFHPDHIGRRYNPVEVWHIKRDGTTVSQEYLEKSICKDYRLEYSEEGLRTAMRKVEERIHTPKQQTCMAAKPKNNSTYSRKR